MQSKPSPLVQILLQAARRGRVILQQRAKATQGPKQSKPDTQNERVQVKDVQAN